jgi:hypothetical protein
MSIMHAFLAIAITAVASFGAGAYFGPILRAKVKGQAEKAVQKL